MGFLDPTGVTALWNKIKATFGVKIPHWTESLKVCMKNLKNL